MNKYLRAVGFTKLPLRSELQDIIVEGLKAPDYRAYTADEENGDILLGQFDIALNCAQSPENESGKPEIPARDPKEERIVAEVHTDAPEDETKEAGIHTDAPEDETKEVEIHAGDPEGPTKSQIDRLIKLIEERSDRRRIAGKYQIGISVCGQFDEKDEFYPDYWYPYLNSDVVSSTEELTVEPRIDNDTFAGVCDDLRVGAALIFRLRNAVEYCKNLHTSFLPLEHASVTLTALSLEGSVMLPIYKSPDDISRKKNTEVKRRRLLNAARSGDEHAMHDLAEAEMITWTNVLSQIQVDDVFTLVESYFMPYGAECELYSVMGDIMSCGLLENRITGEKVCILQIETNGLPLAIAINREDLIGEPKAGRRFKGVIWLQGRINFPLTHDLSLHKKPSDPDDT